MALTNCKECRAEISTSAKRCPQCGAKGPALSALAKLGIVCAVLVAGFVAVGVLTPEYKARAIGVRDRCLEMLPREMHARCEAEYKDMIARGQASAR